MSKIIYMLAGDATEISAVCKDAREKSCFLSDTPNVVEFVMYPTALDWLVCEITVEFEDAVDNAELMLLSAEFTSLTIGIIHKDIVESVIAEGEFVTV